MRLFFKTKKITPKIVIEEMKPLPYENNAKKSPPINSDIIIDGSNNTMKKSGTLESPHRQLEAFVSERVAIWATIKQLEDHGLI